MPRRFLSVGNVSVCGFQSQMSILRRFEWIHFITFLMSVCSAAHEELRWCLSCHLMLASNRCVSQWPVYFVSFDFLKCCLVSPLSAKWNYSSVCSSLLVLLEAVESTQNKPCSKAPWKNRGGLFVEMEREIKWWCDDVYFYLMFIEIIVEILHNETCSNLAYEWVVTGLFDTVIVLVD